MVRPILVTGADGFVGRHFQSELGADALPLQGDVRDGELVTHAVREARPRAIVHLAAESSVADSWDAVADIWSVNVVGTVNVLEAVRAEQPDARVLFVSTGEVYGRATELPTPETAPVAPLSPYAATKAAAELACGQFARTGGNVVVARAFNQEGPGRDQRFAIGSWTRQIARLEDVGGGVLEVGDLTPERDITDVRDACRAYALLLDERVSLQTYNVASGRAVSMKHVVDLLVSLARCPVEAQQRSERMRPVEIPVLCGDSRRLRAATGWQPSIHLERTLADALDYARKALTSERAAAQ